jgi:hypothetical protein
MGNGAQLLLAVDARLDTPLGDSLFGLPDACGVPAESELRAFCGRDLDSVFRPAQVLIVAPSGQVLRQLNLDKPFASIGPAGLPGAPGPEFFVTEDYTAEFGTYSGPLTRLLTVPPSGSIQWAAVRDSATHKLVPLRLLTTGKDGWQPAADGSGDILTISCRPFLVPIPGPVQDSVDYQVTLARLRRGRLSWTRMASTRPDFWEYDMGFPPLEAFPAEPPRVRAN